MIDVLLARGGFSDDTALLRLHHAADLSVRTVEASLAGVGLDDVAPTRRSAPACVLFCASGDLTPVDPRVIASLTDLSEARLDVMFVGCVRLAHGAPGWSQAVSRLLAAGAQDVISLHDEPLELMARIAAKVRRVRREREAAGEILPASIEHRPHVDVRRRELVGPGGRVELTAKEATVLEALAMTDGVVPRDALAATLWTGRWSGTPKAIDMHIANLRRKLPQACGDAWRIETVRGAGFVLTPSGEAA